MLVTARNAAGRLVQQDDGGIEREGAGDIEQFFLTLRQRRREGIEFGAQAEDFSGALGFGLEHGITMKRENWVGLEAPHCRDRHPNRLHNLQTVNVYTRLTVTARLIHT